MSQNGTISEKRGRMPTDHAGERHEVVAVDLGHGDDRRAERTVGDRGGVGDEGQARRGERREAEADEDRRGHRHRRAEAGRALEEGAVGEGDQQQLQPPVLRDVGDRVFLDLAGAALVGELMQEDDVEDDPADRQEPGEAAEHRRLARHLGRHPVGEDRDDQRRQQAEARCDVGLHVQEAEADEHDDHRQRGQGRRHHHASRTGCRSVARLMRFSSGWRCRRRPARQRERRSAFGCPARRAPGHPRCRRWPTVRS